MAETSATTNRESGLDTHHAAPSGFSHVSVPVRNLKEARWFFTHVLGGEVVLDTPGFSEVRIGGVIVGFSEQDGGWTAADAEFPHYAFFMDPDDMVPLKERLESHGIPTHPIWTRRGIEALMYFRDPSGNLFELYCREGFKDADKLPRAVSAGGDFQPPIASLSYDDWKDKNRV
jgi:catechol 2,3-dioxygenase-like lactoylglutathione lyase family enzyme